MVNLILATSNPHKLNKLRWIFNDFFQNITAQNAAIDIVEDGKTFLENAEKKAIEVSKIYNCYAAATAVY